MDKHLLRFKNELDSLWRHDEGFQAQMSPVNGALQELKLLQVQTALEELNLSSRTTAAPCNTGYYNHSSDTIMPVRMRTRAKQISERVLSQDRFRTELDVEPSLFLTSSPMENHYCSRLQEPVRVHRGSLSTSSSFSSQEDTTNNYFSQFNADDSSDWTASLMNQSRTRQPLVLGDNAFADLVGNWLDLPDVDCQTTSEEESVNAREILESSHTNISLDFSKKLSLTVNVFKRVLRSVRQGRDKSAQHGQKWIYPESQGTDGKQAKITCRRSKDNVSKSLWMRTRGVRNRAAIGQESAAYGCPETDEMLPDVFDYSSAVWV